MNTKTSELEKGNPSRVEEEFEGIYGRYRITKEDALEVRFYRLSLLLCGLTFLAGISHWLLIGPEWASLWIIPLAVGIGLALNWIHIYLKPLHRALQIFWLLGCIGIFLLTLKLGTIKILTNISSEPILLWPIGPLFAAITGIGFKEFFCFRRPEAIGLTLLIPIALLGHLSGLLGGASVMTLLTCSALLLMVLALRKFGMDAGSDVGDKSVFNYLENQKTAGAL